MVGRPPADPRATYAFMQEGRDRADIRARAEARIPIAERPNLRVGVCTPGTIARTWRAFCQVIEPGGATLPVIAEILTADYADVVDGFSTATVTDGPIPTTGLDLIFGRPDQPRYADDPTDV